MFFGWCFFLPAQASQVVPTAYLTDADKLTVVRLQQQLHRIENNNRLLSYNLRSDSHQRAHPILQLQRAKRHLALGDRLSAIADAKQSLEQLEQDDGAHRAIAYQIISQAYSQDQRFSEATQICQQAVPLYHTAKHADVWQLWCSYSFLRLSQTTRQPTLSEALLQWGRNPFVFQASPLRLKSQVIVGLALRQIHSPDAISYVQSAIYQASEKDPFLARAYFTLGLLFSEQGERKRAIDIFTTLAAGGVVEKNGYRFFDVDLKTASYAKWGLTRLYTLEHNTKAAVLWQDISEKNTRLTGLSIPFGQQSADNPVLQKKNQKLQAKKDIVALQKALSGDKKSLLNTLTIFDINSIQNQHNLLAWSLQRVLGDFEKTLQIILELHTLSNSLIFNSHKKIWNDTKKDILDLWISKQTLNQKLEKTGQIEEFEHTSTDLFRLKKSLETTTALSYTQQVLLPGLDNTNKKNLLKSIAKNYDDVLFQYRILLASQDYFSQKLDKLSDFHNILIEKTKVLFETKEKDKIDTILYQNDVKDIDTLWRDTLKLAEKQKITIDLLKNKLLQESTSNLKTIWGVHEHLEKSQQEVGQL